MGGTLCHCGTTQTPLRSLVTVVIMTGQTASHNQRFISTAIDLPTVNALLPSQQSDYPALRPLILVLKAALKQRGLADVATGGLGSWSLANMVIAHIMVGWLVSYFSMGLVSTVWAVLRALYLLNALVPYLVSAMKHAPRV